MILRAKEKKSGEGYECGGWSLWRLEPQQNGEQRWSLGRNGPRAYITADESFAVDILTGVAKYAREEIQNVVDIRRAEQRMKDDPEYRAIREGFHKNL